MKEGSGNTERAQDVIGDAGRPLQSKPSGDAHTPGQSGHLTGTHNRVSRLSRGKAKQDQRPGFQAPGPCGGAPHLCGPISTPASPVPVPLPRRAPGAPRDPSGTPRPVMATTYFLDPLQRHGAGGGGCGGSAGPGLPPRGAAPCAPGRGARVCGRRRRALLFPPSLLGRSLRPPRRAPPAWHTGKCSPRLGLCRPRGRRPVTRG